MSRAYSTASCYSDWAGFCSVHCLRDEEYSVRWFPSQSCACLSQFSRNIYSLHSLINNPKTIVLQSLQYACTFSHVSRPEEKDAGMVSFRWDRNKTWSYAGNSATRYIMSHIPLHRCPYHTMQALWVHIHHWLIMCPCSSKTHGPKQQKHVANLTNIIYIYISRTCGKCYASCHANRVLINYRG